MFKMTKRLLQQALDQGAVATLILDGEGRKILYSNEAIRHLLGWSQASLRGRDFSVLLAGGDPLPAPEGNLAGPVCLRQQWRESRGRPRDLQVQVAPLADPADRKVCWLLSAMPEGLPDLLTGNRGPSLTTDPATGLPSRAAFDELLLRDWALARRARRTVSLMLFRIDAFAAYRDVFGRHSADSCLRKVGHAINGCLKREADQVARFGDDEFAALVANADQAQVKDFAERIAERVRLLAIHHPRSPVDRFVTVSHGAAVLSPGLKESHDELIAAAREALGQPVELGTSRQSA
jgi:diguanylate cyclase (GGDEF)-like protein